MEAWGRLNHRRESPPNFRMLENTTLAAQIPRPNTVQNFLD